MSHIKTLIDNETISANGGEAQGQMDVNRADVNVKLWLDGDANSTNIEVIYHVQPRGESKWYRDLSESFTGQDVTGDDNDNIVLTPAVSPLEKIRVTIVNNAGSDTTVTLKGSRYLK